MERHFAKTKSIDEGNAQNHSVIPELARRALETEITTRLLQTEGRYFGTIALSMKFADGKMSVCFVNSEYSSK